MSKKKRFLAALLVLISAFILSATALAGPLLGSVVTALPEADIVDLVLDANGLSSAATKYGTAVVGEYPYGNATPNNPPKYIKSVTVNIGEDKYTAIGFEKTANTHAIGVDLSANLSAVSAALANGFTIETGFTMPAADSTERYIVSGSHAGGTYLAIGTDGNLIFYVGDTGASSGNYSSIRTTTAPKAGSYVHFVGVYDADKGQAEAFVNGVSVGTVKITSFKAGGFKGAFGLGGGVASVTNYTENPSLAGTIYTGLRVYDKAMSSKEAQVAFMRHVSQELNYIEPEVEVINYNPTPDVLDVTFINGDATATSSLASGVTSVEEYGSSGNIKVGSNIIANTVPYGTATYDVYGLKTVSTTHSVGVILTKSELTAALTDGFAVETAFIMPEHSTLTGEMQFIGGTQGGGFAIEYYNSQLMFNMYNGSGYVMAGTSELPEAGSYVHAVGVFDKAAQKTYFYINGKLAASANASAYGAGGSFGAVAIGAGTVNITSPNFTKFPVPVGTVITECNIYGDALVEKQVDAIYWRHIKGLGANVTVPDGSESDEPAPTTDKLLELNMGAKSFSALTCLESGVTATEYSYADNLASSTKVGNVTVKINGKDYKTSGYTRSGNQTIGFVYNDTDEMESAFADGFALETSFVMPEGISGETQFVGGTNSSGFAVYYYENELCFCVHNGSSYITSSVAAPAAGTYCHVVGNFDPEKGTVQLILNGTPATAATFTGTYRNNAVGGFGFGGGLVSATNFTKYLTPAGTVLTSLAIHNDPLTDEELVGAYADHMGQYGLVVTPEYEKDYTDSFEPVVRFMVTSDTHIISEGDGRAVKTAHAIRDAYGVAASSGNHYEELDLIAIAGDISDNGRPAELQVVRGVLDSSVQEGTELLLTLGNHEYYNSYDAAQADFKAYLGEDGRSHKIINGYHFIAVTVDVNGWNYSSEQVTWLEEELAKAAADDPNGEKPIFVIQHVPNIDTILGSDNDYWGQASSTALYNTYAKYPQAVVFAGHSHAAVNDEASILQRDFTTLNTGTLKTGDAAYDPSGAKIPMGDGASLWDVGQYYIVEVDAQHNTRIRIYDLNKDKFIGETYMLEGYTTDDFVYTADRFDIDGSNIFWEEDAQINVVKVTSNLVAFEFPAVAEDSFTTRAFKMVVEDNDGNAVATRYTGWAYWDEKYGDESVIASGIGGLTPETEYTLKIYGINSKLRMMADKECIVSETPLSVNFTTSAVSTGEPVADILDVVIDAENGTITDKSANAMTATVSGSPVIAYDETIGMNTVKFPNNSSHVKFADYEEQVNSLAYGLTIEGYFKVDEWNIENGSKATMGSEQTGGFGFNMTEYDAATDKGIINFEINNGTYKTVTKTVKTGEYNHYVAVYDGVNVTFFVNGNKIAKIACEAPLQIQDNPARVFFLGADTTGAGNAERQSRSSVALARIYSQPLTDAQVKSLWAEVKETRDPEVYPDNFAEDPEYLFWEAVDDLDTNYIKFVDSEGNVHDHADDDTDTPDRLVNGETAYWRGSHLFKSQCHSIAGDVRCKLNFTGTAFRYVLYYRGPADSYGTGVDMYIDGQFIKTITDINAENKTNKFIACEVSGLKDKAHEITFISNTGARVMMDCFEVVFGEGKDEDGSAIPEIKGWTIVDVKEDYISYYTPEGVLCDVSTLDEFAELDSTATWQFFNDSILHNSTGIYGNYVQGAYFTLSFNGTGIRYITSYRGPKTADIKIYIDDELVETVTGLSAENDTNAYKVFEATGLQDGLHTFKAVAANAYQMPIDYLQVYGSPTKDVPVELTSISVTKAPDKVVYTVGEELDLTGMIVTAAYSDNSTETVTDYTVSGYTSTVGTKTVTVTYNGKTATFTVTVIAAAQKNGWVKENGIWFFYENNEKVTNTWKKDSKGWCYLGKDGAMVTNKWVKDSKGWCYVGEDGYCVKNTWKKDSKGWCYLGSDGRMVTNKWVKDSKGWCYVGEDGYCVTNTWQKDSKGWCYLGSDGRMVVSDWVKDGGKWYYLNSKGYMVTGTVKIDGTYHKFKSNGVWIGEA